MSRVIALGMASALLVALGGAASAAPLPPGGSFYDDDGNVHEASIEAIAAESITRGCNPPANDRYCPDRSVTRGQMAAFLVRALDLPASDVDYFVDDDDSVFEKDIQALRRAGVTKGCNPPANDRYCPDRSVTRGQMAAFLARAFDYAATSRDYFVDDDGSIFEGDINRIARAGVTKGCNPPSNTNYCPDAPVRRDQMASFLKRALGLPSVALPTRMSLLDDFAVLCYQYDTPPFEECSGSGLWPAGERFYIRHGYYGDGSSGLADSEFRLYVGGTRQKLVDSGIFVVDGVSGRHWTRDFATGRPPGAVTLVGQWVWDGQIELQVEIDVLFE